MRKLVIAVLLCVPVSGGAKTVQVSQLFNGSGLHALLLGNNAEYVGYIEGAVDTFTVISASEHQPPPFCLPTGITGKQLSDIVLRYMDRHPEARYLAGSGHVVLAMQEAFPCRDG
jgi:hypothetical protein